MPSACFAIGAQRRCRKSSDQNNTGHVVARDKETREARPATPARELAEYARTSRRRRSRGAGIDHHFSRLSSLGRRKRKICAQIDKIRLLRLRAVTDILASHSPNYCKTAGAISNQGEKEQNHETNTKTRTPHARPRVGGTRVSQRVV